MFRKLIQFASLGVALDFFVKQPLVKFSKPLAQFRDLACLKRFDAGLDLFEFAHAGSISTPVPSRKALPLRGYPHGLARINRRQRCIEVVIVVDDNVRREVADRWLAITKTHRDHGD